MESEKPTHKALITKAEAERILAATEHDSPRRLRLKKPAEFLLSGLMVAPDGTPFTGDGAYYRLNLPDLASPIPWQVRGEGLCRVSVA